MKTIIHVGFPKSASSSLQNLWFDSTTAFFAGKRPRRAEPRFLTPDLEALIAKDIAVLRAGDFDLPRAMAAVEAIREMARAEHKDVLLISAEGLSGLQFARYGTRSAPFEVIAKRLAAVFGEGTTALIVVREQHSLLRSFHAQLVKQGYTTSFRTFIEKSLGELLGTSIDDGPLPDMRYDLVIEGASAAGLRPVWMPFEALTGDRRWLGWLSQTLGMEFGLDLPLPHANKTRDEAGLEQRMARNAMQNRSKFDAREIRAALEADTERHRVRGFRPVDYQLPAECTLAIRAYFAPGNARLSNATFDLADYGYAVS